MTVTLMEGDSYQTPIPDNVSLVLTDPPYGTTHFQWDDKQDMTRLWNLLSAPGCPIVCFGDWRLISALSMIAGDQFRYPIIWEKPNTIGFLDAGRRPLRRFEVIGVFGRPEYHKQTYQTNAKPTGEKRRMRSTERKVYGTVGDDTYSDDGSRLVSDVLHVGFGQHDEPKQSRHSTAKPVTLLRLLLRMYTKPGDTVWDPFCGSGSTAVACELEHRDCLTVERDPKWAAHARTRIQRLEEQPLLFEDATPIDPSRFH